MSKALLAPSVIANRRLATIGEHVSPNLFEASNLAILSADDTTPLPKNLKQF
jgi:hypothetical protein